MEERCKGRIGGEWILWWWTQTYTTTIFKAVIRWGQDHAPESTCEQNRVTIQDSEVNRLEEGEGWRVWLCKNLDEGVVVIKQWSGETERLAPQSCVVAMQARAEWSTCYKQLGAGVVVTVGVHRVGEGMNVWEVTPPRLIMILKAAQQSERRKEKLCL